jgi:hypothetical protein
MRVFVLMPFNKDLDVVYTDLIKKPLEAAGYIVQRADDIDTQQAIMKDIVRSIADADLIVAELTGLNANVFYELGIAHSFRKTTILLTQDIGTLPFDLRSYRAYPYTLHYQDAKRVAEKMQQIGELHKLGKLQAGNPITDYLTSDQLDSLTAELIGQAATNELQGDTGRGLYDYAQDAIISMNRITELTKVFSDNLVTLTKNIVERTNEIRVLNETQAADGVAKRLKNLTVYAGNISHYSSQLKKSLSEYRRQWESVPEDIASIFTKAKINTPIDQQAVIFLKSVVNVARANLVGSIRSIDDLTVSILQTRGLSMTLDKALKVFEDTNGELRQVMLIGESAMVRINALCDDALAEYEEHANQEE